MKTTSKIFAFFGILATLFIFSCSHSSKDFSKNIVGTWKVDTSYFIYYKGNKTITIKDFYSYVMDNYSKEIQAIQDSLTKLQKQGGDSMMIKILSMNLQQLQYYYNLYQDYKTFEQQMLNQTQSNSSLVFKFEQGGNFELQPKGIKGTWEIKDTNNITVLIMDLGHNNRLSTKLVSLNKNYLVLHDSTKLDSLHSLVLSLNLKKENK